MGFVIRATGGRVILIHVAKQNGYESCLLFSPEERNVKNVNKENARGMQDDTISKRQAIDAIGEKSDEIFKTKQKGATYPHDDFFQGMAYAENIVKQLPPIQPDNGLQKLADEIASFKRCVKSENSDYLTGYLCALSVVEGMIADMRGES